MSRRISVRATAACWFQGRERRVGELFLLDPEILERADRLPSCLEHVRSETLADDDDLVEVKA